MTNFDRIVAELFAETLSTGENIDKSKFTILSNNEVFPRDKIQKRINYLKTLSEIEEAQIIEYVYNN